MALGTCALCGQQKDLRKSHIVPRFVGKWLKSTSATGFLRGVKNPELRLQDLPTLPLLCGDCEQIFLKLETYFATKIFYPFLNEGKKNLEYDDTLIRFIISLSWRTLKTGYHVQIAHTPWIKEHVDEAEEIWRKFLLNDSSEAGPYEHHMFFFDYIERGENLPSKFQWYTLRATDSTLASNDGDTVFSYTHFPWVLFVSTIFPVSLPGWDGTKIEKSGKTALNVKIRDGGFGDFLISRTEIVTSSIKNKLCKNDAILKTLTKNPERLLNSESFNVMLEESRRERRERKKSLPRCIVELVDIIDRSLDHPELNSLQQKAVAYGQNIIANELSHLPHDKEVEIDTRIETIMRAAAITKIGIECPFETEGIMASLSYVFLIQNRNNLSY